MMKSFTTRSGGFAAAAVLFVFLATSTYADALWDRTADHVSPESAPRAIGMFMVSLEKNRAGDVTKRVEMEFAWDEESREMVLERATEGDRDVTARERRRAERRSDDEEDLLYPHPIFDPEKADAVVLSRREIPAIVAGTECAIYDFSLQDEWPMPAGKPQPITEVGTAFVDLESGMPLKIVSSLKAGPTAVKHYSYQMIGGPADDGQWRLESMTMEFAGQMIIYIAGEMQMTFRYAGG